MKLGEKLSRTICLYFTLIFCNITYGFNTFILTFPCGFAYIDPAGYADEFFWDLSPYHPHGYHELLSGEWGAAIYYDGNPKAPKAMWLTDYFRAPDWPTYCDFTINSYSSWDNPNNPVIGYDTAQSVISNSQVRITIDYEIADLGDGNFSPLMYHESNGTIGGKMSERYVLLQTYTIKNIKTSGDINGLEFYQLIHGHGADDYGPVVHCSYETYDYPDALENYTPYNPVHTVGNFRYDITQWNNMNDPVKTANHTDWVGFSSTVAPNVYECNYYPDSWEKPDSGAHIDIENRTLDANNYTYGRTAGAMGWHLPTLAPGQSTSVTVAFMFATLNWPAPTILTKVNTDLSNECVEPLSNNIIVFDIRYDANGHPVEDVVLTDYLPIEVNYVSSEPNGLYDADKRTVTWNLGDLGPDDSNAFELICSGNRYAAPCEVITNRVVLSSSYIYYTQADCNVDVCPWGSDIIYVDKDANGFHNGTNWNDAYKDLQVALAAARQCGPEVTAIWVAAGTYKPVNDINVANYQQKSFELPDNVALIGHFGGVGTYETSPDQRNLADANNETILEGQIGQNYWDAVLYVVKAQDVAEALVDGFTIRGSLTNGAGVFLVDGADVSIVNCTIKNNQNYGIRTENFSYPDVHNCTFSNNSSAGMYVYNHCWPAVSSCVFDGNYGTIYGIDMERYSVLSASDTLFKRHSNAGFYGREGTLTLNNSVFDGDYYGLDLSDVTTTITDCSVSNSGSYGIYAWDCGLEIISSFIKNSGDNGVYCSDTDLTVNRCVIANCEGGGLSLSYGSNLDMQNSVIRYCGYNGLLLTDNLATTITNNWIHNNGTKHSIYPGGAGIIFYSQSSVPLVRNNTIYDNDTYGIVATDPGADPNIINCIISGNDTNDLNRETWNFNTVNYCLLQQPHPGAGNTTGEPCFMNVAANPKDLHIGETSQCKNAGDPNGSYGDETDIDGESRIAYGRVDKGGDEYYWSKADYNKDEIVNFIDFAILAKVWMMQDPNITLDADADVDIADLKLFCDDWLWKAAWGDNQWMKMAGGSGQDNIIGATSEAMLAEIAAKDVIQNKTSVGLMLPDARASLLARPARLCVRTDKFYEIRPSETISAIRGMQQLRKTRSKECLSREFIEAEQSPIIEPLMVEKLIDWLDNAWLAGEITEAMTEQEYLDFRQSLAESAD